jgi:two-component SAPR family response regulator
MDKKFYISILSKDNFLKTTLYNSFQDKDIIFSKSLDVIDLVIFDDSAEDEILNHIIKINSNLIIINISEKNLNCNCITLPKPIKINDLLMLIEEYFKRNKSENIIQLLDCEVDIQKRVILKNNTVLESLTEKEIRIICYLRKNEKTDRQTLLDKVWNYSIMTDTKVVESNIYKLRQKFKKHNLQNPVIFKNGFYSLDINKI